MAASRTEPVGNTLVMIAPADSSLSHVDIAPGFDIASLVGADGKIAAGDPAQSAAGIYARQAFEHLGVWSSAEPLIARADSVQGGAGIG